MPCVLWRQESKLGNHKLGSTPASCGLVLQSGSFAFGQPLNPLEYLIKSVIKSEVERLGQGSVRLGQPQCIQAMAVGAGIACA